MEGIEEAFSCFLVHRSDYEEKNRAHSKELQAIFTGITTEQQEAGVRQFLTLAAGMTNHARLEMLLTLLEQLVANRILPAR